MKKTLVILLMLLSLLNTGIYAQWLKTNGKKIADETGNEVILRGMGLGGWMLMEGYMMETSSFANPQREIRAKIESLIGPENTADFYRTWHKNHCTERDIDSLSSWGFNSVRLPMHYNLYTLPIEEEPVTGENTWLDEGFALTDSLLQWCTRRHIYLILDLHAAPGGQGNDMAISDYDPSKPSLWESEANKQKTIALWKKLAERYKDEPWIGGYDLINETNWNFTAGANINGCSESSNTPLKQLLKDITAAIRAEDQKHIIIIEGNCWGNNYNGILPAWDNNMVVSFHKYWSTNDLGSIQGMLNIRNNHNIPLWLGESGENSNQWFTDAIRLMEKNSIGWCWWPLKKVSSVVNPLTIPKNNGYQVLLDYWQNGGQQPSQVFALNALNQLAENAKIENCIFRQDVIDAMFRQVNDSSTMPFAIHRIPGVLHASDYDMGMNGVAYKDTDFADYHVSTGTYTAWNSGWTYRNEGVDIEKAYDSDPGSNGYNVGWTNEDEWIQYTVEVDSSAVYAMQIRYASSVTGGAKIRVQCNNTDITAGIALSSTGGVQTWKTLTLHDIVLYKGTQKLKILIEKSGANLGFLKFTLSKKITDLSMLPVSAETITEDGKMCVTYNKPIDPSTVDASGFTFTLNGTAVNILSFLIHPQNPFQVLFTVDQTIVDGDELRLGYSGGLFSSSDGSNLPSFSNLEVRNNLPLNHTIPGKLEAEDFSLNNGLQLENTADTGGGQNIGFTNTGDYLDYRIRVGKTANYILEIREACLKDAGEITFQQFSSEGGLLHSKKISIPVTGGWQTWSTVQSSISLDAGISRLRVAITKPEFNLNWFRFTEIVEDTTIITNTAIRIYPNPLRYTRSLKLDIPDSSGDEKRLSILRVNGELVSESTLDPAIEEYSLELGFLAAGFYILDLQTAGETWRSKLVIL